MTFTCSDDTSFHWASCLHIVDMGNTPEMGFIGEASLFAIGPKVGTSSTLGYVGEGVIPCSVFQESSE